MIAKFVKQKKKYTEDMLPKLENIVLLLDGSNFFVFLSLIYIFLQLFLG